MQTKMLYALWDIATRIGMRRLGMCLQTTLPRRYRDSIFFVDLPREDEGGQPQGYIALTIDDGICRTGSQNNMIQDVCQLLDQYRQAKATFFVCTDYTTREDAHILLEHGHELGNHLSKDISNYYCYLSPQDFERELLQTNLLLQNFLLSQLYHQSSSSTSIRWFRAPQGRMSVAMSQILEKYGMLNVMGDVYCDDWAFAEAVDGKDPTTQQRAATKVATMMMRQVQPGSIAIFHMPERQFRASGLLALETFLQSCQERNLKCVTVSELVERQRNNRVLQHQHVHRSRKDQ